MWLLSQDRKIWVEVGTVFMDTDDKTILATERGDTGNWNTMGEYETEKEAALVFELFGDTIKLGKNHFEFPDRVDKIKGADY